MDSNTRSYVITPEEVSQKFSICIKKAKGMLRVTTQKGVRHAVHPLHRIYRLDNVQLSSKLFNKKLYNDHLLAKNKYLEGNPGAWIYTTVNFTVAYPCSKRLEVVYMLWTFDDDVRIPYILRSDLVS